MFRVLNLVLFVLVLSSCNALKNPEFKEVTNVDIKDVRLGVKTEVDLTADIVLYNPNGVGLKVSSTEFDVFLDDKFVTHISQETAFKLKSKTESTLPISFSLIIDEGDFLSNLGSILGNLMSDRKMELKTKGFVKVKVAGIPVKIPFEHIEPIDLKK